MTSRGSWSACTKVSRSTSATSQPSFPALRKEEVTPESGLEETGEARPLEGVEGKEAPAIRIRVRLLGTLLPELFRFGVYKWNQGRVTRQVTGGVLGATFLFAAWRLWSYLVTQPDTMR